MSEVEQTTLQQIDINDIVIKLASQQEEQLVRRLLSDVGDASVVVVSDVSESEGASVLAELEHSDESENSPNGSVWMIKGFVDGRRLACPQPLLKTKLALRALNSGDSLYLVATDPNSQFDIQSYANHANLILHYWQSELTQSTASGNSEKLLHFLLQK